MFHHFDLFSFMMMTEAQYHFQFEIKDWSYLLIFPMVLLTVMIIMGKL